MAGYIMLEDWEDENSTADTPGGRYYLEVREGTDFDATVQLLKDLIENSDLNVGCSAYDY